MKANELMPSSFKGSNDWINHVRVIFNHTNVLSIALDSHDIHRSYSHPVLRRHGGWIDRWALPQPQLEFQSSKERPGKGRRLSLKIHLAHVTIAVMGMGLVRQRRDEGFRGEQQARHTGRIL